MEYFKYYPLVDCDTEGNEKVPMFFGADKNAVEEKHSLFLEEIVPRYYRLYATTPHNRRMYSAYKIHCPLCGSIMRNISNQVDSHKLALYTCNNCN